MDGSEVIAIKAVRKTKPRKMEFKPLPNLSFMNSNLVGIIKQLETKVWNHETNDFRLHIFFASPCCRSLDYF